MMKFQNILFTILMITSVALAAQVSVNGAGAIKNDCNFEKTDTSVFQVTYYDRDGVLNKFQPTARQQIVHDSNDVYFPANPQFSPTVRWGFIGSSTKGNVHAVYFTGVKNDGAGNYWPEFRVGKIDGSVTDYIATSDYNAGTGKVTYKDAMDTMSCVYLMKGDGSVVLKDSATCRLQPDLVYFGDGEVITSVTANTPYMNLINIAYGTFPELSAGDINLPAITFFEGSGEGFTSFLLSNSAEITNPDGSGCGTSPGIVAVNIFTSASDPRVLQPFTSASTYLSTIYDLRPSDGTFVTALSTLIQANPAVIGSRSFDVTTDSGLAPVLFDELKLVQGWNFVSVDAINNAQMTPEQKSHIKAGFVYDALNKNYVRIKQDMPPLTFDTSGLGMWVYSDAAVTSKVALIEPSIADTLYSGWNIVNYDTANLAYQKCPSSVSKMYNYDSIMGWSREPMWVGPIGIDMFRARLLKLTSDCYIGGSIYTAPELPTETECDMDKDCTIGQISPAKPYCKDNKCVACTPAQGCGLYEMCYYLLDGEPKCIECNLDTECTFDASKPVCKENKCVSGCTFDSDCGAKKRCLSSACVDVQCKENSDCSVSGETCENYKCVATGCTKNYDCPAAKPNCVNRECTTATPLKPVITSTGNVPEVKVGQQVQFNLYACDPDNYANPTDCDWNPNQLSNKGIMIMTWSICDGELGNPSELIPYGNTADPYLKYTFTKVPKQNPCHIVQTVTDDEGQTATYQHGDYITVKS